MEIWIVDFYRSRSISYYRWSTLESINLCPENFVTVLHYYSILDP